MTGLPLLDQIEDELRASFLQYTRRAYAMLPAMREPRILDVGCGSGVLTVELGRLGGGTVTAVDPDAGALERLRRRVDEAGLAARITARLGAVGEIELPAGGFDLVWAEGSIQFLGFAPGLKMAVRLLRDGGFVVVHDDMKGMTSKLALVPRCGLDVVGHFPLPESAWWEGYYALLDGRLDELFETYGHSPDACRVLEGKRAEVRKARKEPAALRSFFLIAQKRCGAPPAEDVTVGCSGTPGDPEGGAPLTLA